MCSSDLTQCIIYVRIQPVILHLLNGPYTDPFSSTWVTDLFQLCTEKVEIRSLSVLIFIVLRKFGVTCRDCDNFLYEVGGLCSRTCQKWTNVFVNGDFDDFCQENRGGKRASAFYDVFPEIELQGKVYAVNECRKKSADFSAIHLAEFIDGAFYQLSDTVKTTASLVRSIPSCRLDLRRWGARFDSNSQRPYFEGHDRPDVIADREKFIRHFLENRHNYYQVSDGDDTSWVNPLQNPSTIVICE